MTSGSWLHSLTGPTNCARLLIDLRDVQLRPFAGAHVEIEAFAVGTERWVRVANAPGAGPLGIVELADDDRFSCANVSDHHGPETLGAVERFPVRGRISRVEIAVRAVGR